jgi:hypothetical protein
VDGTHIIEQFVIYRVRGGLKGGAKDEEKHKRDRNMCSWYSQRRENKSLRDKLEGSS